MQKTQRFEQKMAPIFFFVFFCLAKKCKKTQRFEHVFFFVVFLSCFYLGAPFFWLHFSAKNAGFFAFFARGSLFSFFCLDFLVVLKPFWLSGLPFCIYAFFFLGFLHFFLGAPFFGFVFFF